MCTSKSQGGQRCVSSTTKALTNATKRFERSYERYQDAVAREASPTLRADARARAMRAWDSYEDAMVEHATTDQGRIELEALRDAAPAYLRKGENGRTKGDYDDALISGRFLRERRAEIKQAVRNGEMSAEEAEKRSAYPNEFAAQRRAAAVEDGRARELAAARPPVSLPAGVTAERDERITDFHFSCENHNKPGQCTQECTDLEYAMSGDDGGVPYDPTGTTYGPPRPHTEYHYDEAQRASIAVTYMPV